MQVVNKTTERRNTENKALDVQDLHDIIESLKNLYLGIYGTDENEILEALELDNINLEAVKEYYPELFEDFEQWKNY